MTRGYFPLAAMAVLVACGSAEVPDGGAVPNDIGLSNMDAASWMNVVINFDNLAALTHVTNQYASATFSARGAASFITFPYARFYGSSPPSYACPSPGSEHDCTPDGYIDFTHPVRGLRFNMVVVDSIGTVGTARIFQQGTATPVSVELIGKGNIQMPVPVDLSAYPDITRLEIVNDTDGGGGFALDDFTFQQPH